MWQATLWVNLFTTLDCMQVAVQSIAVAFLPVLYHLPAMGCVLLSTEAKHVHNTSQGQCTTLHKQRPPTLSAVELEASTTITLSATVSSMLALCALSAELCNRDLVTAQWWFTPQ